MAADPNLTTVQTPTQWAVRWHGVVLAMLLVFSVPVFHLTWHVVLGHEEPPIVTRSQVLMPEASWETVTDGTWMTEMDRYLREQSPIVWRLRGTWNEALLRCGLVQSERVHLGREGWMFLRASVFPDVRRFDAMSGDRRRVFARVRDLVRAAGAELVVSLVPDKARIYPEFAFKEGVISASKEPLYRRAVQELRDEGIAVVDMMVGMAAARAAAPDQLRYYYRDSHWRAVGALIGAQAVSATIEALPAAAGLAPRNATELGARTSIRGLGGLVPVLGLLSYEKPHGEGRLHSLPMSLLTAGLTEEFDSYSVVMRAGGRPISPLVDDLDCEILLIGTSFSEANGARALALWMGRPVRLIMDYGVSGLPAISKALDELKQGTRAKVVVWEIAEPGLMVPGWKEARF